MFAFFISNIVRHIFQVVLRQEINPGTTSFSCNWYLKSVKLYTIFILWREMFSHSCTRATSHVSKKEVVLNLPTFLISIIRGIYTKLLTFLKSSVKTNVTSGWTFFVVFLTFVFKEICMETRMCNIFKSTDVMKLTKTILESIYKVLQSWWKRTTNGQYNFQKPFNPRIIFV